MTSNKQIEANRRNALLSTGPSTTEGKMRSRSNAMRHGLTSETVIFDLEDADDYQAFESAIIADYDVETAVERELVLRLASLLWRLRRAGAIETCLFEHEVRHERQTAGRLLPRGTIEVQNQIDSDPSTVTVNENQYASEVAQAFLQMMTSPHYALDRLSRYEGNLWRQATHALYLLAPKRHGKRARTSHRFGSVNDPHFKE